MSEEEMSYHQILDQHQTEIACVLKDYREKIIASQSFAEVLALRREQNAVLVEMLDNQRRVMCVMAGEKIEPKTHYAEAVLVGVFGGSAG